VQRTLRVFAGTGLPAAQVILQSEGPAAHNNIYFDVKNQILSTIEVEEAAGTPTFIAGPLRKQFGSGHPRTVVLLWLVLSDG